MHKFLAPVAVAAAVAAIAGSGIADGASPKLAVKVVHGPAVPLGPFEITELNGYNLRCPSGYYITGIGTAQGANDVVYADFYNAKTASFAFANPSDSDTFKSFGSITCVKGQGALRAHAASSDAARRQLLDQAREAIK